MRDLLGGKGAGLAEMTKAGCPCRPASRSRPRRATTTSPPARSLPDGLWDDVLAAVSGVEQETGKGFGDPANPLLVSVRSGAKFSMPGMMDTVLNLGLNERDARRAGRADRQRALRVGRLPALHPDVRAHRDGRRRRAVRARARRGQEAAAASQQDTDLDAARSARGGRRVPAQIVREATGPRVPGRSATSSSTWRSRPSSPRGSASAPPTTASTTRSPTTWARRSTS